MAYTKSKKLTTAEQDETSAASAVKNYGSFNTSNTTNQFLNDRNNAYNAVSGYGDFNASDALKAKEQNKINTESAVTNYGDFNYGLQSSYDDVINQILNRKEFTYDVNGDALYQQYKDQYVNQGKMAMMDTMGQASAMTGGYGNSYAQSVGQQAYQGYLQQLNDKIPELYRLALDKYNSESENMYNQYSMLSNDRATQYGEFTDGYNRAVADRDYYGNDYYKAYNNEYGQYMDKYGMLTDQYNIASDAYNTGYNQDYTKWESGLNQLVDQRDYTSKSAANLYNQEYGEYMDKQANDLALAQFEASTGYTTSGQKSTTYDPKGDDFKAYTYARSNTDGTNVFYRDGKEYTVEKGTNPYTGTKNADAKHGTFSNGYQPNNVNGKKLSKTGITDVVNGVTQNVWKTPDGQKWIWDGTKNAYLKYED